jgi:hypothetical protein
MAMKVKSQERITLYIRPEHRGLLQWAKEYTQADSISEAVWQALRALRDSVKGRHLRALEETHGIWRDDPQIEEAFRELEAGWEEWQKRLEGS